MVFRTWQDYLSTMVTEKLEALVQQEENRVLPLVDLRTPSKIEEPSTLTKPNYSDSPLKQISISGTSKGLSKQTALTRSRESQLDTIPASRPSSANKRITPESTRKTPSTGSINRESKPEPIQKSSIHRTAGPEKVLCLFSCLVGLIYY